jgi:hypothetical protein
MVPPNCSEMEPRQERSQQSALGLGFYWISAVDRVNRCQKSGWGRTGYTHVNALTRTARSEQQATGLERFELLGKLEGVDVFDMNPIEMTRLGTVKEPIPIYSLVSSVQFASRCQALLPEGGLGRGHVGQTYGRCLALYLGT